MFACKFELPDSFGARVTATREHIVEAMAVETGKARREALRKGLFEACLLLRDVSKGAVSYELTRIIQRSPAITELPPPPVQLEEFLEIERDLLREVGVSEVAIEDIEQLIREVREASGQPLRADDMLQKFQRLQELTCSRSRREMEDAQGIRTRAVWWGVAGTAVVVVNAGAAFLAPILAATSAAIGGAIIGKAVSEG